MPAPLPGRDQPETLPAGFANPAEQVALVRKPTGAAREQALSLALERFGAARLTERADDPDGWVTALRTLPAAEARYAPWPELIDPRLRAALESRDVRQLYTHQAASLEFALSGRHVVVTTPTASGKTLCYNAPVLSTVLADPATRALYLFPTKALAQDQLAELKELTALVNEAAATEISAFTYDGDTPQDARRAIRTRAHIVLSNPDMVHSGILPHHPKWARLFENPPVVNKELGIRRSYLSEARRVAGEFLKRQLQLIVFCQSRLSTEILTTYLKDDFEGPRGTPEQVRGYRGGYLPLRRREIERGLRASQVRAVVATNALELGIDIGALDTVVMAGYPGTIASTWQRAGRAGRRQGRSAAVMVASSAPIDQYIVENPRYFFERPPEEAHI